MREASGEFLEYISNFCQAVYNAESEEEIEFLRENLKDGFRQNGFSEEEITAVMNKIDSVSLGLELGTLTFGEDGKIVRQEEVIATQEVEPDNVVSSNSQANTSVGVGFGVVGAAVVASLALKKKILKSKKKMM